MSVADGMAHPRRTPSAPPRFTSTKNSAGTAIPPTAAATGSAARRGSRRSPATNSRLSSRPATKKKIASSPSAAQVASVRSRCSGRGADPGVEQRLVGGRPGGVGPDERDGGADQQQDAADGLLAQDVGDPAGLGPRAPAEDGRDVRRGARHGQLLERGSGRLRPRGSGPPTRLPGTPVRHRTGCRPATARPRGPASVEWAGVEPAPAAPPRERSVRLEELAGVRVGVWGHGREGHAAVRAALTAGAAGVHVVDSRPVDPAALPAGATASADVADLAGCDVVVRSPGISPYRAEARDLAGRTCVTTGTGVALAEFARRAVPTLCVTGTKGKSTTSALAAAVLEAAGRPAVHAGNIGTPLLDVLLDGTAEGRTLVVEISSYQAAAVPDFAGLGAVTSLAPEHLDWHGDVATYYRDKLRVFTACPPRSVVVAPQARPLAERYLDPAQLADPAALVPAELAAALRPEHLLGEHNLGNARVALAACALLGVDLAALRRAGRRRRRLLPGPAAPAVPGRPAGRRHLRRRHAEHHPGLGARRARRAGGAAGDAHRGRPGPRPGLRGAGRGVGSTQRHRRAGDRARHRRPAGRRRPPGARRRGGGRVRDGGRWRRRSPRRSGRRHPAASSSSRPAPPATTASATTRSWPRGSPRSSSAPARPPSQEPPDDRSPRSRSPTARWTSPPARPGSATGSATTSSPSA